MAQYDPLTGIVGVVGKDPQIKSTSKGDVTEFSLAVSDGFGQGSNTVWYRVSVWDELSQEAVQNQVRKGSHVAVQGTEKPGRDGYGPDMRAFRVTLLNWFPRGQRESAPAPVEQDDADF